MPDILTPGVLVEIPGTLVDDRLAGSIRSGIGGDSLFCATSDSTDLQVMLDTHVDSLCLGFQVKRRRKRSIRFSLEARAHSRDWSDPWIHSYPRVIARL